MNSIPNVPLKVKDRKAKHIISEKLSLLRLLSTVYLFFSDLKYQMKVLPVELHQSYSWSQDRRSMEYSVQNQIANRLIVWVKRRKALSFKFILNTKFCCGSLILFWRDNVLAEFWPRQFYICNVKCDICYVTRPDKWHVKYNVFIETYYKSVFLNHPVLNLYSKSPHHHLLVGQKPSLKPKYIWRQTPRHVAFTNVRGGTYFPTGRT